jgi:hypothetical protein
MKPLLSTLFLAMVAVGRSPEDCKQGYATTIVVQFPDGSAVSGANIRVEVQCGKGGDQSQTTDSNGEARFAYSLDQLGAMKITLAGFSSDSVPKSNCSGSDKDKRCVVKLGS